MKVLGSLFAGSGLSQLCSVEQLRRVLDDN